MATPRTGDTVLLRATVTRTDPHDGTITFQIGSLTPITLKADSKYIEAIVASAKGQRPRER